MITFPDYVSVTTRYFCIGQRISTTPPKMPGQPMFQLLALPADIHWRAAYHARRQSFFAMPVLHCPAPLLGRAPAALARECYACDGAFDLHAHAPAVKAGRRGNSGDLDNAPQLSATMALSPDSGGPKSSPPCRKE
jgi:hypothetical protein